MTERAGSPPVHWAVPRPEEMLGLAYLYHSSILQLSPRAFSAQGWANLHSFRDLQAATADILKFAKQLFASQRERLGQIYGLSMLGGQEITEHIGFLINWGERGV